MTVLAQDDFSTSYADLSGNSADVGGTYSVYYRPSGTCVIGTLDAGFGDSGAFTGYSGTAGYGLYRLGSGTDGDADHYVTDWGTSGGDQYDVGLWARGVSAGNEYEVISASNVVTLYRRTSGTATSLGSFSGGGTDIRIRLQTTGSSPTTLKVRAWNRTGSEGTTWSINTTDNTAGNQTAAGAYGILARKSSAASSWGDDYLVATLDTYQPRPGVVSFGGIGIV